MKNDNLLNLYCATDIETTGDDVMIHEIIEIAIVPLNYLFEPDETIPPFYARIKPMYPESADPTALEKHDLDLEEGVSSEEALEAFILWIAENKIDRKLELIAHKASFEEEFIKAWLNVLYKVYIYHTPICTLQIAKYIKRMTNMFPSYKDAEGKYHSGLSLPLVAIGLGIDIEEHEHHSALHDALLAGEIARVFLTKTKTGELPY